MDSLRGAEITMSHQVESEKKKPIRVLRIIARMNLGGPAMQITGLYREMDTTIFETKIICGYCESNEIDFVDTQASDVPVVRINGLGRSVNLFRDVTSLLHIINEIRKFRPTIVHTHTAKAGVLGRVASLLAGQKIIRVHTFHGHLLYGYFKGWKLKLVVYVEKLLSRVTDHLVAVGSNVRGDLLTIGIGASSRFSVIRPGVIPISRIDKVVARRNLKLNNQAFILSFIGRLENIKRIDRLLEALAIAKDQLGDYLLLIAGDGQERSRLESMSRELGVNAVFLGWQDDLVNIISASDVSIHTSDNEGIPVSLIQSSFCAVPSISTNVGSVSDIVIHNETGILCESTAVSVASAIISMKINDARRIEMGKRAKQQAEQYFTLSKLVQSHERLYKSLSNGDQSN